MEPRDGRRKAVLVAVQLPEVTEQELASSLAEMKRLLSTLGYDTVATVTQARSHLEAAAVVGEGKLAELAELTSGTGEFAATIPGRKSKAKQRWESAEGEAEDDDDGGDAEGDRAPSVDLVAVDHDISPSQARNLERALGVPVLDRAGVIIEIFHQHAKSRQARLEVEIARLTYQAPRLRESPSGRERQRGRGAGEAALELDRRRIRDRIAELRDELEKVQREQGVRRVQRRNARRVALVGYTNAGKSSLMRALTGSDVYVENKLFATLDTTVRALHPEVKPRILVSDTVGFIKKLPHDLVASFKSTLDEALEASLILHVVDAADPDWRAQFETTRRVLSEIGADEVPSIVVMNKMDRVEEASRDALVSDFPEGWFISAHRPEDVAEVRARLIAWFEALYQEREFFVPYAQQAILSEMHDHGRVAEASYDEQGVRVVYRAEPEVLDRYAARLSQAASGA